MKKSARDRREERVRYMERPNQASRVLVVARGCALFNRVAALLSQTQDFLLVGRTTLDSHSEGMNQARELRPDLIIVEVSSEGLLGLDAVYQLRGLFPDSGIITVGAMDSRSDTTACRETGSDAFILQDELDKELVGVMRLLSLKVWGETSWPRVVPTS